MKQEELDIKYKDFEISTRVKTEMVKKYYRYVTIEGKEFDFDTIYRIMEELDANYDIVITDKRLGEHFKKLGILKTMGSKRWYMGAEKGDRFKQLMNQLDKVVEELYD